MITIEKLVEFGADTATGLGRCAGKESLYLRLVSTVPKQPDFDRMAEAIAAGDFKTGFEAAHSLKGILGNLSLSPLYEKVCEITDYLRNGTEMDYSPLLSEINAMKEQLTALCD